MSTKNWIVFMFFAVMLIGLAPAQETQFVATINQSFDFSTDCAFNGFPCDSTFDCRFTLTPPDKVISILNQTMTRNETIYNITIGADNLNQIGGYKGTTFCNNATFSGNEDVFFDVTPTGTVLSTGEAILYLLFLLAVVTMFFTSLFWAIRLPFKNIVNAHNEIISVNDLKYLKVFLSVISYVLLMWIFGLLQAVTRSFLFFFDLHLVFQWFYSMMLAFLFPGIVLSFLFTVIILINDQKLLKKIRRFDFT